MLPAQDLPQDRRGCAREKRSTESPSKRPSNGYLLTLQTPLRQRRSWDQPFTECSGPLPSSSRPAERTWCWKVRPAALQRPSVPGSFLISNRKSRRLRCQRQRSSFISFLYPRNGFTSHWDPQGRTGRCVYSAGEINERGLNHTERFLIDDSYRTM